MRNLKRRSVCALTLRPTLGGVPMRRSILPVFLLILFGLTIYGCGKDTVAPTEPVMPSGISASSSVGTTPDGSGSETTDDFQLERGRADKVDICHIPPGNPDNVQLINVSGNVVAAHEAHGDFFPLSFWPDVDGDGFGDGAQEASTGCVVPQGFVENGDDCDDADNEKFPGNVEICDGKDNNCNGEVDESDVCKPLKTVFITSTKNNGRLGGLAGADAICQGLAQTAGLGGRYMAWLADGTGAPSTRFNRATSSYVRTDGVLVAYSWNDLTDCTNPTCLQNPITRDEFGASVGGRFVDKMTWSNVSPDGFMRPAGASCSDWTSFAFFPSFGHAGFALNTSSGWTGFRSVTCVNPLQLYCFEQ